MNKIKHIIKALTVLSTVICISCFAVCYADVCCADVCYDTGYSSGYGHTHDWHYTWDNGLYATCAECGSCASVCMNTDKTFTYCPNFFPLSYEWVEETDWTVEEIAAPAGYDDTSCLEEYHFVYADIDSDNWQEGIPTSLGTYKVSVALGQYTYVEDISGDYGTYNTYATVRIGHIAAEEWTADGQSLCLDCISCCNHIATITLSEEAVKGICTDDTVTPHVETEFADEYTEDTVTVPDYTILYKGKKRGSYPLSEVQPSESGEYTMHLALLDDPDDVNSASAMTSGCAFSVESHSWTYYTFEYTIYAQCSACGEHAEVTLDTSTVYEASRGYDGSELDYDVFYEKDWSRQDGIEPYCILFSGKQTVSETSSRVYDHAFVKPTSTGNYSVRIALLEDEDDPDTAWISTKEKPYYLADIPMNECDVLTYGDTQTAQFTEPEYEDGYYQVGTLSELMWCVKNRNSDADISLTNDIVVNPITVTEDGEIRCAGYQIYKWTGFGTEKKPYTGTIEGNGYTIYGLYQPDTSSHYNGFVTNGKNCEINNLTVENSVIYGTDVSAIVGHYDHNSIYDDRILNCQSLNCYLSASNTCGGIIGWLTTSVDGSMKISGCVNDSIVCGDAEYGAGGIVGRAEGVDAVYIQQCSNIGSIESEDGKAGGIIGQADLATATAYIAIWDCFNIGSVTSPYYVGGIAGYMKDYNGSEEIYFDNCTSTGYLSAGKNVAGIVGYIETKALYDRRYPAQGNYYYNAKAAFNAADPSISLESHAEKLSRSEANGNFICSRYEHTPCSHWVCVSSANCTEDGELMLECAVCGEVLEKEVIRAYGHRYEYGECVYCGAEEGEEEDEDLFGTISGDSPLIITIAAVSAMLLVMCIWLIFFRKRDENAGVENANGGTTNQ